MIFTQKQLFQGTTTVALRAESLYVCKRNPQGVATFETEVPYEEILPVKAEESCRIPVNQLLLTGLLLVFLGYEPWRHWLATGTADTAFYSWWLVLGLNLLASYLRFEQQWSTYRLQTDRKSVV